MNNKFLISSVAILILLFPITFLTVRHGVHFPLFALLLISIYQFWSSRENYPINFSQDASIIYIFSGLFVAVLISQAARGIVDFAAFDGPSRILFAGIVFIFLKRLNISYIKILSIAIPVALICILISILINPNAYWGGRFAIYFVDPNTLGSQSFILASLSLLMIQWHQNESRWLIFLQLVGGLIGLYISIGSGSRGGWLSTPFLLLIILCLRLGDIARSANDQKKQMYFRTASICLAVLVAALISFYFSDKLSTRIISGYHEIFSWLSGTTLDSSAGIRLSMWKISFQLVGDYFWFGSGELGMSDLLIGSYLDTPTNAMAIHTLITTGPHSDILSKLLSGGILSLLAYFAVLLWPLLIFWRLRNEIDPSKRLASRVGIYYTIAVFIAGLSNEQLSLKYLCTFYGLMLATLLAQVLHESPNALQAKTSITL
jgi:O-antigen ligase